ncbi:hypothetical protein LCGC14_1917540 [marine sediment metagenome]|uniref:Uncharacterized protein n=1 Tax=marine sediment metagenome TaxID=412755 RepID=A0A0F9FRJ9_9ZZZZ
MIPITVKVTLSQRNYLDAEIKKGKFASYGHSMRALIHYYRVMGRENSKLRSENARMKGILEVVRRGEMEPKTFPEDLGYAQRTETHQ